MSFWGHKPDPAPFLLQHVRTKTHPGLFPPSHSSALCLMSVTSSPSALRGRAWLGPYSVEKCWGRGIKSSVLENKWLCVPVTHSHGFIYLSLSCPRDKSLVDRVRTVPTTLHLTPSLVLCCGMLRKGLAVLSECLVLWKTRLVEVVVLAERPLLVTPVILVFGTLRKSDREHKAGLAYSVRPSKNKYF